MNLGRTGNQNDVNIASAWVVSISANNIASIMLEMANANLKSKENFKYLYAVSLNLVRYLLVAEPNVIVLLAQRILVSQQIKLEDTTLRRMIFTSTGDELRFLDFWFRRQLDLQDDDSFVMHYEYFKAIEKELMRDVNDFRRGQTKGKIGLYFANKIGLDLYAVGVTDAFLWIGPCLTSVVVGLREAALSS